MLVRTLLILLFSSIGLSLSIASDPCKAIAKKTWVSPAQARACLSSFPLTAAMRTNTIQVLNKTLAFHSSLNYQISAPRPYQDTQVDLVAELDRIDKEYYCNEFEFHLDVYRTFLRGNDGHLGYSNYCYDDMFTSYLPLPLVLLTDEKTGVQNVHIAPEAFSVASAEFKGDLRFWQNSLPKKLKGKLASLNGAKVLRINGRNPFDVVNRYARVMGNFQSFATRQNMFFASYRHAETGSWEYFLGAFAQQTHPTVDSVELTVQRLRSKTRDTFTIPYRSRYSGNSFKDSASYRQQNCKARRGTNVVEKPLALPINNTEPLLYSPEQQQSRLALEDGHLRRHLRRRILPSLPMSDISLPKHLQPKYRPLNGSFEPAKFFMLNDRRTGVLALGSFDVNEDDEAASIEEKDHTLAKGLLQGLQGLKASGATRLIIDVSNNGGGIICIAHWLHRILMGQSGKTFPQAGFDSTLRAGPLAQLIVDKIITANTDPNQQSMYNPLDWKDASHRTFPAKRNWLKLGKNMVINGRNDVFSERMGDECQPFSYGNNLPTVPLFNAQNIIILSNGQCISSCSIFSIRMAKSHGVRTVVAGGAKNAQQDYCGTIGGQVSSFTTMNSEIRRAGLKSNALAPPDFTSNSALSITWRLAYGIDNPNEPEEWQAHRATINFPVTAKSVNNPSVIWQEVARKHFGR